MNVASDTKGMVRVKIEREENDDDQKFIYIKVKSTSNEHEEPEDSNRMLSELLSIKQKYSQTTLELKKTKEMLSAVESERLNLMEGSQSFQNEIHLLKEKIDSLEKKLEHTEANLDSQTTSLNAKKIEMAVLNKDKLTAIRSREISLREISALKVENRTLTYSLMKAKIDSEILLDVVVSKEETQTSLETEKKHLTAEVSSNQNEINALKSEIDSFAIRENELKSVKRKLIVKSKMLESTQKILNTLRKQKNSMKARLAQIQSSTSNKTAIKRPAKDTKKRATTTKKQKREDWNPDWNIYEVETLLDHKMENGVMFYLVRWTSYGPEDDTWIKESSLSCPKILASYKKSKSLS